MASSCACVFDLVRGRETADVVERSAPAGTAKKAWQRISTARVCGELEMMTTMAMVTMMTMLSLRLLDLL